MALQARDAVMMIVAFLLGLLLVSALLSQSPSPQSQKENGVQQNKKIPILNVSGLGDGRCLLLLQDGTVLLCKEKDGVLEVLEEYSAVRSGGRTLLETPRDENKRGKEGEEKR
ncbi:MAG: hypothetical protein N2234_01695 [Planctomycetota bacterium]|nr:hypothetical protein [Planctomycetota bacterium]